MRRNRRQSGYNQHTIGWLRRRGGGLLPHQPPPALSGDGARRRFRSSVGVGVGLAGLASFHVIDEGFDSRELLRQVPQASFEGVELLVEVVQSVRQRLDPEQRHGAELKGLFWSFWS